MRNLLLKKSTIEINQLLKLSILEIQCSFCLHFKTKKKNIDPAVLTFIGYKQTDKTDIAIMLGTTINFGPISSVVH